MEDAFLLKFKYIFRKKRLLFVLFACYSASCVWTIFRQIVIFSLQMFESCKFRAAFFQSRIQVLICIGCIEEV